MKRIGYYIINILIGIAIAPSLSNSSVGINVFGLILLFTHSFIIWYYFKDPFLFMIYLFALCVIRTDDKLGGIVLAPFIIFLMEFLTNGKAFSVKDKFVKTCLFVLIVTNFLGYLIKNQAGNRDIIESIFIFSGSILTFMYIQNFKLTKTQISVIFKVFTYISLLLFLVALNQKYVIINSSTFLLGALDAPSVSVESNNVAGRIPSLLGDYELFSEFALLMFILSFSIFMSQRAKDYFNIRNTPFVLLFISLLNIIITGTRSGFILAIIFLVLFFLIRSKAVFSGAVFKLFITLVVLVPFLIQFGDIIGFDLILKRLKEIDVKSLSINNIKTGEELNRAYVYAEGYKRLGDEDWIIGNGLGTKSSNNLAWFGNLGPGGISLIADFHSLYLCIPMIYGWIGSLAYLSLLVYIIFLLTRKYLRLKDNPLNIINLALALAFFFFLINEIKINSLRYYNYHYLIWILLGFALSINRIRPSQDEDTLV